MIGEEVIDAGGTQFKRIQQMSHSEFEKREMENSPNLKFGERKNIPEVQRWASTTQNINSYKEIEPGSGQSEKDKANNQNDRPGQVRKDQMF
jgi:hypothetical protein